MPLCLEDILGLGMLWRPRSDSLTLPLQRLLRSGTDWTEQCLPIRRVRPVVLRIASQLFFSTMASEHCI